MSKVVVTGASGFLGEPLCIALAQAGHDVVAIGRDPGPALKALAPKVQVVAIDLLGDPDEVKNHLAEALRGASGVYHAAGLVSRDPDKGRQMMRLHVDGTRALLSACKEAAVKRMVLISTSGTIAVSKNPEPIPDESAPYALELCAGWPYYLSKIYQEKLALDLGPKLGIEVVVLNPSLLLGPGDRRGSSTMDVRRALCGQVPFSPPGGLSFVDVRDVVPVCLAAMERGKAGSRYLLGGPNWTFAEFFSRISRIAKVDGPKLRLPAGLGSAVARLTGVLEAGYKHLGHDAPFEKIAVEMANHYWYCDSDKARTELGFDPRDPAETLDDTVRDLRIRYAIG